jgi:hypothetical protein
MTFRGISLLILRLSIANQLVSLSSSLHYWLSLLNGNVHVLPEPNTTFYHKMSRLFLIQFRRKRPKELQWALVQLLFTD